MKPNARLLFALTLAVCLLLSPGSKAEGQVFVGAHGSLIDVRGATFGIGARFGAVLKQSGGFTIAMEGVGEYLFPPCDVVECDAISLQGNFLFRRQVVSYAEAYAGVGIVYQDFSLEDEDLKFDGNDIGFNLLVGSQAGRPGGVRPFLEVRITFMDELENQAGASFGIRVPLGS